MKIFIIADGGKGIGLGYVENNYARNGIEKTIKSYLSAEII